MGGGIGGSVASYQAQRGIRSGSKLIESLDMAQPTPELLARLRLTVRRAPIGAGRTRAAGHL